jgi:hypothetical protein
MKLIEITRISNDKALELLIESDERTTRLERVEAVITKINARPRPTFEERQRRRLAAIEASMERTWQRYERIGGGR